jgi:hypothetical protein
LELSPPLPGPSPPIAICGCARAAASSEAWSSRKGCVAGPVSRAEWWSGEKRTVTSAPSDSCILARTSLVAALNPGSPTRSESLCR